MQRCPPSLDRMPGFPQSDDSTIGLEILAIIVSGTEGETLSTLTVLGLVRLSLGVSGILFFFEEIGLPR